MERPFMRIVLAAAISALLIASGQVLAQGSTSAATVATKTQEPYGAYLVDSEGMSLYLFKADMQGKKSTCYDACAKAWPPLLTEGEPQVDGKADKALLDTIERKDGSTQVTYNGWPLYYYVKDKEPGDTKGQDVKGFGAEWYLLTPQGKAVHAEGHGSES